MIPPGTTEPRVRGILTYHSIDESGSPISVSPEAFREHIRFLASGRVRVVGLDALLTASGDEDLVALTFDDGCANFATLALPLLEAHGMPATVFVVTDHVGRTNAWGGTSQAGIPTLPLMDWETLARAQACGIAIGAHTRRHRDLTTLPPGEQELEIAGSADRIASELGVRPTAFAYPYGRHDERSVRLVRAHFPRACTTHLRVLSGSEDAARLPRLDAWYFRAPGQLEGWGTAAFRSRIWLRARGRRVRQLVFAGAGT